MNTRPPAEFAALIDNLRDFIDTEVILREDLRHAHDSEAVERTAAELYAIARSRGLGAPRAACFNSLYNCSLENRLVSRENDVPEDGGSTLIS